MRPLRWESATASVSGLMPKLDNASPEATFTLVQFAASCMGGQPLMAPALERPWLSLQCNSHARVRYTQIQSRLHRPSHEACNRS